MSAIRGKGKQQQQEVGVTRAERRVANPPCAVNKTWNEEEEEEVAAVSGRIGRVGKLDSMFHLADRLTQPGDHVTIVINPPLLLHRDNKLLRGGGGLWHEQEC